MVDGPRPWRNDRSRFVIAARRIVIAVGLASGLLIGTPAWAGIEDALKALQAGDVV